MKLLIEPMGAPRMTQRDRWKGRPVVLRYHSYKDALRAALPGYELPMELEIIFRLPMPKSWSKKKRTAMNGQPHGEKPDIDNLCKGFMDTFKGEDGKGGDKHVYYLNARKFWSERGSIEINYERSNNDYSAEDSKAF